MQCALEQFTGGNVGNVIYGVSEERLLDITGNNDQNPTFSLQCRQVFSSGQKNIKVIGPFPEIKDEIVKVHEVY